MDASVHRLQDRRFRDRTEAGQLLAQRLSKYVGRDDVVVLALPRGGVPVAAEIAKAIHAPLDVFLVRKIGVPGHEELAMGAVATGNVRVLHADLVHALQISESVIESATAKELQELARREGLYRAYPSAPDVRGKTVVLVDDGLATGATMHAAVAALKQHEPAHIVIAVPVAPSETCDEFRAEVDEVVCAETPESFEAVGLWFENFAQLTDDDVRAILENARQQYAAGAAYTGHPRRMC
jgi:putative phosphoribosyl transferase